MIITKSKAELKEHEEFKKALEKQQSASKATAAIIKEEVNRTTKHKKVFDRIRKSHMVQSEIRHDSIKARSRLPLPSSCNPLLQNTAFVDDVSNLIIEEQAQIRSATKQVVADR